MLRFHFISYQNTCSKKLQASQVVILYELFRARKGKSSGYAGTELIVLALQLIVAPQASFTPLSFVLFFLEVKSQHAAEKAKKEEKNPK